MIKEKKKVRKEGDSYAIGLSKAYLLELIFYDRIDIKGDIEFPVKLSIKRNGKQAHLLIPMPLVKKYNMQVGEEWHIELVGTSKKKEIEVVRL